MKNRITPLIYYLLLMLCTNTGNAQTASNANPSPTIRIIEEKNALYFAAIEKNDAKAFEEQFSLDSWIMVPNAPVYCGPTAAADYFNEMLLKKEITKGKFITVDLYGVSTDIVVEVGFYQLYNKNHEQFDDGKFIVLWKRVDGQWKRHRQTLSSSRPNGI